MLIKYDDNGMPIRAELWGSSTNHPDSVFLFSDHKTSDCIKERGNAWDVYQWMIEIASSLAYPMHTIKYVEEAHKYIVEYMMKANNKTEEEAEHDYCVFATCS